MPLKALLIPIATMLLMVGCTNGKGNAESSQTSDSCATALKFEMAMDIDSGLTDNYSGELNNYWGEDKTKLDFKHVFKNGELVHSYFYYENGTVQEEYTFKCEALHGLQKWYHPNGKLAQSIPYSYGRRDGIGQRFDEHGRPTEKLVFKNDSIVDEVTNPTSSFRNP